MLTSRWKPVKQRERTFDVNGTERLYEKDAYLTRCEAAVLSARKLPGEENPEPGFRLELILDRTVFFPEGGGQSSDIGWICRAGNDDGSSSEMLAVTDVQIEDRKIIRNLSGRVIRCFFRSTGSEDSALCRITPASIFCPG